MRTKVANRIILLYCVITFSLLGNSIAFSQGQVSDTSDLQKKIEKKTEELSLAASNATKKKLEEIKGYLKEGGWDIDKESGMIIAGNDDLQKKISEVQENIKNLFIVTAEEIEQGNKVEITINSNGMGLTITEKERKNRFLESKKRSNISIASQAIAIKVLYGINRDLIDSAEREVNRKKKIDWYITQAVFAYELSSTIIEMIDGLSLTSMEDLHKIYDEEMKDISEMEDDFKELMKGKNKQLAEGWLEATGVLRTRWNAVLEDIGNQEDWVKNLKEKKGEFENFAKMAVNQVRLLGKGIIVEQVMEQMEAVRTVLGFDNIPLVGLEGKEFDELFYVQPLSKDIEGKSKKLEP